RFADETHTAISCFCSPHHQDSAYYPPIRHLERAAKFSHVDGAEERYRKLEALLQPTNPRHEDIALLADMLSIPIVGSDPISNLSARQRRERTIDVFIRQTIALAKRAPLLLTYEDVHWIDPSSRELVDAQVDAIVDLPVLLLVTFRPEFVSPWTGHSRTTMIVLNGLNRGQVAKMVEHVTGTEPSEELCRQIAERSDGVPLFVEELTKTALERGALALPESLHDSLMARVDRLPAAKELAQTGAVIGRCFGHEQI